MNRCVCCGEIIPEGRQVCTSCVDKEAKIGNKYRVRPAFAKEKETPECYMTGKVVYVHPKRRYAVLEFKGVRGNPRESFFMDQLTERNRVPGKKEGICSQ